MLFLGNSRGRMIAPWNIIAQNNTQQPIAGMLGVNCF